MGHVGCFYLKTEFSLGTATNKDQQQYAFFILIKHASWNVLVF